MAATTTAVTAASSTAVTAASSISWLSLTTWAELATIATALTVVLFASYQFVVPWVVRSWLRGWGDWPAKITIESLAKAGDAITVIYDLEPRPFTLTERRSPRIHRIDASVQASLQRRSLRLDDVSSFPIKDLGGSLRRTMSFG